MITQLTVECSYAEFLKKFKDAGCFEGYAFCRYILW